MNIDFSPPPQAWKQTRYLDFKVWEEVNSSYSLHLLSWELLARIFDVTSGSLYE